MTDAKKPAQETPAPTKATAKGGLKYPAPSEYKGDLPEGVRGGVATIDNPEEVATKTK